MKKIIDAVIIIIVLILLALAFITGSGGVIHLAPLSLDYSSSINVLNGITSLIVAFLGIVTIFDLFLAFGWEYLVPKFIVTVKKRDKEEIIKRVIDSYSEQFNEQWENAAKTAIDTYYGEDFSRYSELLEVYFNKDLAFVKSNQQTRTDYILEKLKLTQSTYGDALECLTRLRAMSLSNGQDAVSRIECALREMPGIIIQQKERPADRTYKEVQFYLDFVSSMRDNEYGKEISETFAQYILLDMEECGIKDITKVVIPSDSNFLLGFKVGEILGYPPVTMRNKPGRIFKDRTWDGELTRSDRVIIVHDVLVSGDQVVSAMKKIKGTGADVCAVYCIVNRLEYPGERKISQENSSCKVRAMLDLDDKIISKKYYNGGRKFRFPLKKLSPTK